MTVTNDPVVIGGITVRPGERVSVSLPVANLYTASALTMPVEIINGRKPGPVMFVCAAIHGDELNGVEIVRRLLRQKSLTRLRGCLIAVPIVNVHGFLDQSRYLPDRRDLNRSFPGSAEGSVAGRLAHVFSREIIAQSDYGIDLHTGALHRANLPQIRGNLSDPHTLALAREFDVPVLIDAKLRDGSLRGYAAEKGIPTLLYETGEALRFDQVGIRAGLRGVIRVMRKLGMLPAARRESRRIEAQVATATGWVRAPQSGIVRHQIKLGERVARDTLLCRIGDPCGEAETEVHAPFAGIVIGQSRLPLTHEGDALYHIARFDSVALAAGTVEDFRTEHEDAAGYGSANQPTN